MVEGGVPGKLPESLKSFDLLSQDPLALPDIKAQEVGHGAALLTLPPPPPSTSQQAAPSPPITMPGVVYHREVCKARVSPTSSLPSAGKLFSRTPRAPSSQVRASQLA